MLKTFSKVCIVGAAGKMGRGIALLFLKLFFHSNENPVLILIDSDPYRLEDLGIYLRSYLAKWLLKEKGLLQEEADLKVEALLSLVRFSADLKSSREATIVFEATSEDIPLKLDLLGRLCALCGQDVLFLSNTSSIPISFMAKQSNLEGRVLGFHFYNPPPVQKLVEVVYPKDKKSQKMYDVVNYLKKEFSKTIIVSDDIAGFIGNGYFIRELLFAFKKVKDLTHTFSLMESFYLVNKITSDYLIRPMGVFQLLDYIGIDIAYNICRVMEQFLPDEDFEDPLLNSLMEYGILGGQAPDGTQRNGIFCYENQEITGIYDVSSKSCRLIDDSWKFKLQDYLGGVSQDYLSWKILRKEPDLDSILHKHFRHVFSSRQEGALLAREFLENFYRIGVYLLNSQVSESASDVNSVIKNGFAHLYGPLDSELTSLMRDY